MAADEGSGAQKLFNNVRSFRIIIRPVMRIVPRLTEPEWKRIAPCLPPGKAGRRRHADRDIISALLFLEAADLSAEAIPPEYEISFETLRTRRARWRATGIWPEVLSRGQEAIKRMRREHLAGDENILEILSRSWGINRGQA